MEDEEKDSPEAENDVQEESASMPVEDTSHQQNSHPISIDHQSITCSRTMVSSGPRNSAFYRDKSLKASLLKELPVKVFKLFPH